MKATYRIGILTSVALGAAAANAAITEYKLFNHPDGTQRPPTYGLRLDELFNVTNNHDVFTFDFNHSSSDMRLHYNDNDTPGDLSDDEVHIFGIVFGGLDAGSSYDPNYSGLWIVDFTYRQNIVGRDPMVEVNESLSNNGYIQSTFGMGNNDPIGLWDEAGNHGYSFKFNNVDNHRLGGHGISGPQWFVGWGWLNHHDPNAHVYASDWLFVGQVVPEPASLLAVVAGLGALAARRRKK